MKRLGLVFVVLAMVSFFCSAVVIAEEIEEKKEEKIVSAAVKFEFLSQRIDQTGEKLYSGPVFQPSLFLTHNPTGLYVGTLAYVT